MIRLIYIGERFYQESGTSMSPLVRIDTGIEGQAVGTRFDWGDATIALQQGADIYIRPATAQELRDAEAHLRRIQADRAKERA